MEKKRELDRRRKSDDDSVGGSFPGGIDAENERKTPSKAKQSKKKENKEKQSKEKETESADADLSPDVDVYLKLHNVGVDEEVAKDLSNQFTAEYIEQKLLYFQCVESLHPDWISKNPQGYLVKSIIEDYEPPSGFDEWYDEQKRRRN